MGLFRIKKVTCPGGEWTTLVRNFAARMPASWTITLSTIDGSPVSGEYEEKRSFWIFPQEPLRGPLSERMTFERRWINTMYSIKVRPAVDTIAEVD
jgi:hypothetical protein